MPLVIPKLDGSSEQEWIMKLMGKTLTDGDNSATAFSRKDLPEGARVVGPDAVASTDVNKDRLTVFVDNDGIVKNVQVG